MSGLDLWSEICETKRLLDLALSEAKSRGWKMNEAEANYYTVKDLRVRELLTRTRAAP